MRQQLLWVAMASAGLLSACGGGGGDAAAPTAPSVTLSGVAAKGLMANALVKAYAVRSDGTVDRATALATATTNAQGQYTLSFAATQSQPYVIEVEAQSGTTHLDEVTGQSQALPSGFKMRSLYVPSTTGTASVSMSITPFSEMAVAAAEKASGGITPTSATQAISTVQQILGFNPAEVAVKSAAQASSDDEKKLIAMLTAVSQMADSGSLGCAASSSGEKVKCVVEGLAKATSTTSKQLTFTSGGSAVDVGGALAASVSTVVATRSEFQGTNVATLLAPVKDSLACVGDACKVAVATPVSSTTATAIKAAKDLFADLKSDWLSLFSRGSATNPAAFNAQASKFEAAMKDVQVPAEVLAKDLGTMLMGIDMYNDFKAGRTTSATRATALGLFSQALPWTYDSYPTVSCRVAQDSNGTLATAPANANYVLCRAVFAVRPLTAGGTKEASHSFTLTPSTTQAGVFTYQSRARVDTPGQPTVTLKGNLSGTVTTTLTDGDVTAVSVEGTLPGAIDPATLTLATDSHSWSVSGNRNIGTLTATVSGTVVAKAADGTTLSTLKVNSGSLSEVALSRTASGQVVAPQHPQAVASVGSEIAAAALDVKFTTPKAEFEGSLAATDSAWDKSRTVHAPTKLALNGALRTIDAGTVTEFISGQFTLGITGTAAYDATAIDSASNFVTLDAKLVAKVTAPSRPTLELTLASSGKSHEAEPATVAMTYRSLVNGSPKRVIDLTLSRSAQGVPTLALKEAASNLSLTVVRGAASADLLSAGTKIGQVTVDKGLLTFTDGSFVSIDTGL